MMKKIIDTGKDWVLILLNQLDKAQRAKMLFLWWRACHMRDGLQPANIGPADARLQTLDFTPIPRRGQEKWSNGK
jgi:hypothetical protein